MVDIPSILLSQTAFASVAHRYWRAGWSHDKNYQVYGHQASPEGIGSNLRLKPCVHQLANVPDKSLSEPIARMKAKVDHRSLFEPGAVFANEASTLEKITEYLARELFREKISGEWHSLTVHESDRLACTVFPSGEPNLHVKRMNLKLTLQAPVDPVSGLVIARAEVEEAIENLFRRPPFIQGADLGGWSEELFQGLKSQIKILKSLRIDLGSHEYILVQSDS